MALDQTLLEVEDCWYNSSRIREMLDRETDATLNSLIILTRKGDITLDDPLGKVTWRTAIHYLQDKGLIKELHNAEKSLYEIGVSERGRGVMEIRARLRTVLLKSVSFWDMYCYKETEMVKNSIYHRYVMKQIS